MGNTKSSFHELQDTHDDMTIINALQHENQDLKLSIEKLNRDNHGLIKDIKTERIKRIHVEKSIADLLENSLCEEYLLTNNIDVFEKQMLYKFVSYTRQKWVETLNKHYTVVHTRTVK